MAKKARNISADKENPQKEKDFLTVALGASAGGIKALTEFFAVMPADSGMAFVVILHLSETHKSNLAEIIQRKTKMNVTQVEKAEKVEPNKVYVIPPGKHLEMLDGIIKLKEPPHVKGIRVPIDRFFRTMADVYGRKAVCIILSGTGSDGTLGMKHVKGRGGFAIIQDPKDAEYDGMPRSAIETKIADVVLPVAAMPEKLLFVRDTTQKWRLTDGDDGVVATEIKNIDLLRDVLTLLRVRTGHDFSNYKRPTLIRRLARHLQVYETDDLREYLEILRRKPEEVVSLLKNLLINVTNFFRDKEAFAALVEKVIPALFEGKNSSDQVRVWIAGCSTGEEAYSITILLAEYAATLTDPPKIQVFASDVDEDALTEAREGHFTETIVSDVSPERLQQFFIKEEDNGYRIRKNIREMILFAPHNILRDPPFSRLDLVSCRNVMIYLNRETQEQVLKIFHFALHETGYLFLGSSETADSAPKHFTPVDKKQRIYRCRPSNASWNMPPPLPLPGVWMPKMPEQPLETHNNLQSFGELHHRLIEYYAPPSILINEEGDILHLSENAGRFLRFVGGEPSANIIKAIHPALLSDVRAALFTARKEKKTVEAKNIRVQFNGDASTGSATEKLVNITVRPVGTPEAAALIMFEENTGEPPAEESMQAIIAGDQAMETVVRRMEEELHHTKDRLRNTVEQYETSTEELKASNEELQAINEELRSTAEELETSKEELQSVNEELITVNNELKEKVEEVGHANSDLENLMRSTDIATIFLDRGLNIKRYTPRVTDIFNLIPSDAGRPLSHITHRLSPDNFQKDAAKVLQSLQPMEREVRSEDGRAFIVRFSPYRTLDDKIDGVVISFIDITEREKAEQRIKDERAYAEAIISTVRGPIIVLDKNLRVVSANRSFYKSFKVSPEESEEKFIYDLGNRQWDIPKLRDLLENILPEKNEFQDFEVEHKFEKIGQRTMLLNAREIIRTDGIERLILLAFEDITERKKTEQALRESEENYRVMVNQAVAGILKTDRSGNIIFTNDQFEKMMGYTAEELLQMNIAGLVHEKDREHHTEMFETMQKGGEGYMIEKRLERKDGYYIWVNNYNAPIFAGDGSLRSVAIVSVDITDQKAIEKQKDDFIGIASHELKTPLTSIKACTELLQEVFAEDEETQNDSLVKTLNGQVDRLTRLVSDLLDTTRITGSQLDLKQETFDLNKLIEECVGEAQLTTSKHQLIIKPGDVSPLHADRERIGQVIINLLTNAIKYSPDANQVIIFSENIDNKEVKISVHDFGIGVGPEVQQKIFKRFYQAKTSDKSSSGLGLGLYISMQIIKSHGGEMGVESQPGKGSIFYFKLPYELNKKHPA